MKHERNRRRLDGRELGITIVAALALTLLWYSPFQFPVRFFSVLVHECSHAIAGMLTGGVVDKIDLNQNTGGVTQVHGGIAIIVGSAGYLGSVLFGSLFLYLSRARRHAGLICLGVGLFLAGMTLSFVSLLHDPFGFFYGSIAGLLIALIGWKFKGTAPYFMKFLGVSVLLFGFMDIQRNLFSGAAGLAHSDAGYLANATGIPAILWAVVWLLFSSVMALFFGYLSATTGEARMPKAQSPSLAGLDATRIGSSMRNRR